MRGCDRGSVYDHGREIGAEIVEEVVEDFQFAQGVALLAELAQRRLKVVGLDGQIVGIAGRLRFLQSGEPAVGVFSALEHVGAVEIDAGAEHDGNHGGDVVGRDHGTAMIRVLDAAANLRGEVGQGVGCGRPSAGLAATAIGVDVGGHAALKAKGIDLGGRELGDGTVPGRSRDSRRRRE